MHLLSEISAQETDSNQDSPPGALILVDEPLIGGSEEHLSWLVTQLGESTRCVVVSIAEQQWFCARRLRMLSNLTPLVYNLSLSHPPALWQNLLERLINKYNISHLLHFGLGQWFYERLDQLLVRFPTLTVIDQVANASHCLAAYRHHALFGMITHHLAVTNQAATLLGSVDELDAHSVFDVSIGVVHDTEPVTRTAAHTRRLRDQLGIPSEKTVIGMWADLVPEKRPEDFVALAARFKRNPQLYFLLAGDGPLATTVSDLVRLFQLERFILDTNGLNRFDLLAVADIACTTSESEPYPVFPLAALGSGTPMVAAAVDDIGFLVEHSGSPAAVVENTGDISAFEQALTRLLEVAGTAQSDALHHIHLREQIERNRARYRQVFDLPISS